MKLVTFAVKTPLGDFYRLGALVGAQLDRIIDLNTAYTWLLNEQKEAQPEKLADVLCPADMRGFIEMGPRALEAGHDVLEAFAKHGFEAITYSQRQCIFASSAASLTCPLPNPNSLRDFLAFEVHTKSGFDRRKEPMPEAWYKIPVYYKGNHRGLIGPEEPVLWPHFTRKLDYELELACIVGKESRNLPIEEAQQAIFGYTILNDISARDIQAEEMRCRLGPAKAKDFGSVIGPWIVTADEIPDPRNLTMTARVNGEVWSQGNSGTSHWTFEQMLSHVSMDETLYPSDILGSGTVGNGCGLELDRWIQPGDVIELEISGLGVLRNTIGSPHQAEHHNSPWQEFIHQKLASKTSPGK
ncbi:MAG: fumarylacetoacetate hydrolase family protein [Cyanobacteria bacterium]|nr:fumarylacetoacetate hydrolase family protein [Cyanobacteriota bacterium]